MESLAAALIPDGSTSSDATSQSNAELNRLLDEITFRLERRFLLRLFDKHSLPQSLLDNLPPVPGCQCKNHIGGGVASTSQGSSGSGYEDIEILRYKAKMIVNNAVGDALQEKDSEQYFDAREERLAKVDMFANIGGPDNMTATNSLYVVRRAALRTLLKYTCKGKANALLHLTDYLQQQIDSIDEANASLDAKATRTTKKQRVRFEPLEESKEEFDDTFDEYDDVLPELPAMHDRSKKTEVPKKQVEFENPSDPVSLDSNYTFNLRKTARQSLTKYLHKSDAVGAMMHLFDSTKRLELADDFAEIHASDNDMLELLHTPFYGTVASAGGAAPQKRNSSPEKFTKRPPQSGQQQASPDRQHKHVKFGKNDIQQKKETRFDGGSLVDNERFFTKNAYPASSSSRRDYDHVCTVCQAYLDDIHANMTTNNNNHQKLNTSYDVTDYSSYSTNDRVEQDLNNRMSTKSDPTRATRMDMMSTAESKYPTRGTTRMDMMSKSESENTTRCTTRMDMSTAESEDTNRCTTQMMSIAEIEGTNRGKTQMMSSVESELDTTTRGTTQMMSSAESEGTTRMMSTTESENTTRDATRVLGSTKSDDEINPAVYLYKFKSEQQGESDANNFEYNPSSKKVIRLHGASSSKSYQEEDNDIESSVSQKVGYFDRVLNSEEDSQETTKQAETITMSEETRAKVGFWEKMCGCCHSEPPIDQ
ncbi:uncharacterized protein [Antedon mediterranea]|uniref:uncharacterized protein n=1 Tax=Antedon mediterranea TaxID=105859 RepID=UPI003AF90ACA